MYSIGAPVAALPDTTKVPALWKPTVLTTVMAPVSPEFSVAANLV